MPKVTVYIRNEDYDDWKNIADKTDLVADAIHTRVGPPSDLDASDSALYELQKRDGVVNSAAKLDKVALVGAVQTITPGWKPCKHGADPKFCKHAKPGKPCK